VLTEGPGVEVLIDGTLTVDVVVVETAPENVDEDISV